MRPEEFGTPKCASDARRWGRPEGEILMAWAGTLGDDPAVNFRKIWELSWGCAMLWAGLAIPVGAATDWTEFRGPTGQGHSDAKAVPMHWSGTSNVVWKVAVPGQGWSSPVVVQDRIYLTTAIKDSAGELTLNVLCLRGTDGQTIWNREIFRREAGELPGIHSKNGQASPTPIFRAGRLYVHFGHLGTAALTADGDVLWRQSDLKYTPVHGNGGSPVLLDDKLIFSVDAASEPAVVGLSATDGKVLWRTPRNTPAKKTFSFCTPLVIELAGTRQVVLPGSGFVAGYAPADGRELWRVRYGEGYSVVPRPVYAHGLLFIGTGYDRANLMAIRPAGAVGDATDTAVAWQTAKGAPNTPSTINVGDEIYFVSDSGTATCADARTGKVHWNERLGGDFSSSPVYADGRLYFQNETGTGVVLKPGTQFEVLARNELGERSLASYAVADQTLYIRGADHLFRIGQAK